MFRGGLFSILLLALAAVYVGPVGAAEAPTAPAEVAQPEAAGREAEVASLRAQVARLQAELAETRARLAAREDELAEQQIELDRTRHLLERAHYQYYQLQRARTGSSAVPVGPIQQRQPRLPAPTRPPATVRPPTIGRAPAATLEQVFILNRGDQRLIEGQFLIRLLRVNPGRDPRDDRAELVVDAGIGQRTIRIRELTTITVENYQITTEDILPAEGRPGEGRVRLRVRPIR